MKKVHAVAGSSLVALGLASAALAGSTATATGSSATGGAPVPGLTSGLLPTKNIILPSTVRVNLDRFTATLPLHKGVFHKRTVWYVLTEASDEGAARDLNLNFAPKLANTGIGCDRCVQDVSLEVPPGNKFGPAVTRFQGIPNFAPKRVLKAGPTGFPPAVAKPGSIGGPLYSPFIRFKGSKTVYNAPIVAVGKGRFDVVHHTNTEDRVMAIHPARPFGAGQYSAPSVELLLIRGFDSGQPILYISTDASDPVTATLERANFVPLLRHTPFMGGDDFLGSVRERIFTFVNGQTGRNNPEAQGLAHLIKDGYASQDASLRNHRLINALRLGGDALNIQGDFPTLSDPHRKFAYSPLWEAQFGQWTPKAVRLGLNKRQTDEFKLLNLVATRQDLITGPFGTPYGSTNILINCPVIGFLDKQPTEDLVTPLPKAQVETSKSFIP